MWGIKGTVPKDLYKQFNIDALTLNKAKAEGEGSAEKQ